MEPYFTTVVSAETVLKIGAVEGPWVLHQKKPVAPADRIVHSGDVVLVLPHLSKTRPEKFPSSLDTYIIHPATGRRGWFWSALLCNP